MRHLSLVLAALCPAVALAVPVELPLQGRLLDASGGARAGAHTLRVELLDGSDAVLFANDYAVTLADGYYAVRLTVDEGGLPLDSAVFRTAVALRTAIDGAVIGTQPLGDVPTAAVARELRGGPVVLSGSAELVLGQSTATTCATNGALVFDPVDKIVEVCVDGAWTALSAGGASTLGDPSNPADSCQEIRAGRVGALDGAYWLQPPGEPAAFRAWCEMDLANGGWTLVGAFSPYAQASYSTATYMAAIATTSFPVTENPGNVFVNAANQARVPHTEVLIAGGSHWIRVDRTIGFWTASFLGTGGTYPSNEDFPILGASWSAPSGKALAWWCSGVGCNENINLALADGGVTGCSSQRIQIDTACSGTGPTVRLYVR